MSKKQLDDKHQKILRKLLQLPENKKCFDCTEKGPFYACTTLGTFVCTTCSGIHREFQHHVKSISMASFKPEEVQFLEEMGNARAKEIWLAYWTPDDFPEPESSDRARVREFMKLKYEKKKWYAKPGAPRAASNGTRGSDKTSRKKRGEEPPRVEPIETILGHDIPPITITHNHGAGLNGSTYRREEPRPVQPAKKDSLLVAWEDPLPAPMTAAPIPAHLPAPGGRSPQMSPQFPGAPTATAPVAAQGKPAGHLGGLESVFTQPEPTKTPASTIWPPPAAGAAPSVPQMGVAAPGMGMPGAPFPQGGAPPFVQVTPQMFQQMTPQQQQQYLIMQQQWIQQQQLLLQQRMAHMNLSGGPGGAPSVVMPPVGSHPPMGVPGGHSGAFPPAMPPPGMVTNPFLVGAPVPPGTGGVLTPSPYGSSSGAVGTKPTGVSPLAPSNEKNDSLFADLSPIPPKPSGGVSTIPSPAAGASSPLFRASPAATSAAPNPFGPPPSHNQPGSGGFPPPAGQAQQGFNPFGSLI